VPEARLRAVELGLADLTSVKSSANRLEVDRLDAVVHNAGVLSDQSRRAETVDGRELTFGTNHLGHWALTAHLMPFVAPGGRIVVMGSMLGKSARLDLDDLQSIRDYWSGRAYGRSKLAQMLFGFEFDRRLRATGSLIMSVVVHPGGGLNPLTPSRPAGARPHDGAVAEQPAAPRSGAGQGRGGLAR
jgi:NAD(P)-dependent dehydrogenase (short-subunit alcohol dehydrogenase family)